MQVRGGRQRAALASALIAGRCHDISAAEDSMLTLPEQLLLISIDQRGRPRDPNSSLGYALAGAALTELLLAGRLRHDHGQVVVATASPIGDTPLDEVVAEVRAEQRPRTLK
jgi:hypothetical protein